MTAKPYRVVAGGVRLDVRLTPKGGRDRIDGLGVLSDGRAVVLARVSTAPEKGAANKALERLVAAWLAIAPSRVAISSGDTARLKTLAIEIDEAALLAALEQLTPAP